MRLWRRIEGRFVFGYRLPRDGGDGTSEWSRSLWCFSWLAAASWPVGRRFELLAGPRARLGVVQAEARALDSRRTEQSRLWEVSVGGVAAARLKLGRRLAIELTAVVAWLPLGHELSVRGTEVLRSGGLELSLGLGAHAGFF